MAQSAPASREEFKALCFRQLGEPVIKVNVDDVQAEDAITIAVQYFQEFHYDGTEKSYLKHQITAQDIANGYVQMAEGVNSVTQIFPVGGTNQSMTFFDLRYQLRLNDLWDLSSTSYVNYALTMQHLRTLDMIFSGETPIDYNKISNRLYIHWDWSNDIEQGQWIIVQSRVVTDPNAYSLFWNDRMLKALGTAYIKKQWGNNMKKFGGMQLPGGITMNGQQVFDEAVSEIKDLEQTIRDTYQEPPGFLVG
jgi:hypothetical protein